MHRLLLLISINNPNNTPTSKLSKPNNSLSILNFDVSMKFTLANKFICRHMDCRDMYDDKSSIMHNAVFERIKSVKRHGVLALDSTSTAKSYLLMTNLTN